MTQRSNLSKILDDLLSDEGGLKKGEISIIMGKPHVGKTMFHHIIPTSNKYPIGLNLDILKENGFDTKGIVRKYEKIGDTIFPVTHFPNGIVVVDYPDNALIPKKNV